MALQTSTGYVRIAISTGFDDNSLTVNWMTFDTTDWRESNPKRVFSGIVENGSNTFDLAIKEMQEIEGEQVEVITGYLPQSKEQAYLLLQSLSVKDADFASVNFSVTEQTEGEVPKEIYPFWSPDMKLKSGNVVRFFDGEWKDYEVIPEVLITELGQEPPLVPALYKLHIPAGAITDWKQPLGAHDAYAIGVEVTHKGSTWMNTIPANVYEPGVFGWNKAK